MPTKRAATPGTTRKRTPLGSLAFRNQILAAAAVTFAERGAAATNVEHLLASSGLSRKTFYRFFASKDDVLDALHEQAIALFLAACTEATSGDAPVEVKVRRWIATYLRFGRESGTLMVVLAGEAQRSDSPLAVRRRATVAAVVTMLDQMTRVDDLPGIDPFVLHGIIYALDGITRTLLERGRPTDADFARAEAAMVRIALAALARPGATVPALPETPEGPG